ncbi:hypothetical protein [Nitrosospira multiformis]|uniref:hypothetical protein n=1 Tax=Nitrosospira multiformis TaxID=1231 RepID=UPI0009439FBE|nr:hypothetical protein [Nitrosospira multiformis]
MFATVPKNEEFTFTQMAHFWALSERANLSQCPNFGQVQEISGTQAPAVINRPIHPNQEKLPLAILPRLSLAKNDGKSPTIFRGEKI